MIYDSLYDCLHFNWLEMQQKSHLISPSCGAPQSRILITADVWILISTWIGPGCYSNILTLTRLSAVISVISFPENQTKLQWALLSHFLKWNSWLKSDKCDYFIHLTSGLLWWFHCLCFYDSASVSWYSLSAGLPYGLDPAPPVGRRGGRVA